MTARHSTYKHPKKWEKASVEAKVSSKHQRMINRLKKINVRLSFTCKVYKKHILGLEQAINWATESGKVTKKEFAQHLKRLRDIKKDMKITQTTGSGGKNETKR